MRIAQAAAADAELHAVLSSSDDFEYGRQAWDLIVITYALVPVATPAYAATITAALAPGGCVVIESFAAVDGVIRRPVDLDPDALRTAYQNLDEVAFEVEETTADWTLDSAQVVRLAAESPARPATR